MRYSEPVIDRSLEAVYRQAREAAGAPISERESWTLELLVGVDSGLEALDGVESDLRPAANRRNGGGTGPSAAIRPRAIRSAATSSGCLPAWLLEERRGPRETEQSLRRFGRIRGAVST